MTFGECITTKITTIKQKIVREGKDGKKYLILKTNPNKIFVFSTVIPENEWNELEEGKTYQFELKDGRDDSKKLVSFTRVIVIENGKIR